MVVLLVGPPTFGDAVPEDVAPARFYIDIVYAFVAFMGCTAFAFGTVALPFLGSNTPFPSVGMIILGLVLVLLGVILQLKQWFEELADYQRQLSR